MKRSTEEPCRRCVWKSSVGCPYSHGKRGDVCIHFRLSAYHRKKERMQREAKGLGELMARGIIPKYALKDKVYLIEGYHDWEHPCSYVIREIIADVERGVYRYKVHGHTEYTYTEDSLYPTEQMAMEVIVKRFVESTAKRAMELQKRAKALGMSVNWKNNLLEQKEDAVLHKEEEKSH